MARSHDNEKKKLIRFIGLLQTPAMSAMVVNEDIGGEEKKTDISSAAACVVSWTCSHCTHTNTKTITLKCQECHMMDAAAGDDSTREAKEEEEEMLPETALGWVKYLYLLLQLSMLPAHTQRIGRALMQLILTGSFDGADLFEKKQGDHHHAPVAVPVPKFISRVRISFGIGSTSAKATESEKLLYMNCLASLLKRGFKLSVALPAPCDELSSVLAIDSDDTVLPTKLRWYGQISARSKRLTDIARRFRCGGDAQMSTAERHAFIVIWAFAFLSDPTSTFPDVDLINLTSTMSCTAYDFVARAL